MEMLGMQLSLVSPLVPRVVCFLISGIIDISLALLGTGRLSIGCIFSRHTGALWQPPPAPWTFDAVLLCGTTLFESRLTTKSESPPVSPCSASRRVSDLMPDICVP